MQCVERQLVPPSGAAHSVSLRLLPDGEKAWQASVVGQLITARDNALQIWNVEDSGEKARLVHVATRTFSGIVCGLTRVRTVASKVDGADRILVAFLQAKMTLMEWSVEEHDLVPISLHTFEKQPQLAEKPPILATDPKSRVSVLYLAANTGGDGMFAVLPYFQEDLDYGESTSKDAGAEGDAGNRGVPYAASHIVPLSSLKSSNTGGMSRITQSSTLANASKGPSGSGQWAIRNVMDMAFLPGFNEPTLAVLHSPEQTWAGSLDRRKGSVYVSLVTLSSSVQQKSGDARTTNFIIIATSPALPYTCFALQACPQSLGGVVVISGTGLFHLEQNGKLAAGAVNPWFYSECAGTGASLAAMQAQAHDEETDRQLIPLWLEGARIEFVNNVVALMSTRSGALLEARFNSSGRSVSSITVTHVADTSPSASLERIRGFFGDEGLIFLGSEAAESALLRWSLHHTSVEQKNGPTKIDDDDDEEDLADSFLYGSARQGAETRVDLKIAAQDFIHGHGSVRAPRLGKVAAGGDLELVAATGSGSTAGLSIFYKTVPTTKVTTPPAPQISRVLVLPSVLVVVMDTIIELYRLKQDISAQDAVAAVYALRTVASDTKPESLEFIREPLDESNGFDTYGGEEYTEYPYDAQYGEYDPQYADDGAYYNYDGGAHDGYLPYGYSREQYEHDRAQDQLQYDSYPLRGGASESSRKRPLDGMTSPSHKHQKLSSDLTDTVLSLKLAEISSSGFVGLVPELTVDKTPAFALVFRDRVECFPSDDVPKKPFGSLLSVPAPAPILQLDQSDALFLLQAEAQSFLFPKSLSSKKAAFKPVVAIPGASVSVVADVDPLALIDKNVSAAAQTIVGRADDDGENDKAPPTALQSDDQDVGRLIDDDDVKLGEDDDDELNLYSDDKPAATSAAAAESAPPSPKSGAPLTDDATLGRTRANGAPWAASLSEDNSLSIFLVQGSSLVPALYAKNIHVLPEIIEDGTDGFANDAGLRNSVTIPSRRALQVSFALVGDKLTLSFLFPDAFILYEAVPTSRVHGSLDQALAVRFVKTVSKNRVSRDFLREKTKNPEDVDLADNMDEDAPPPPASTQEASQIHQFNAQGKQGLFISGADPFWVLGSHHGPVHAYNSGFDRVTAFSATPSGIAVVSQNACNLVSLKPGINVDTAVPIERIPRNRNYNRLVVHQKQNVYVAAALHEMPFVPTVEDSAKAKENPDLPYAGTLRSTLELLVPGSWRATSGFTFRPYEFVTSMECLELASPQAPEGVREFIVVGTCVHRGEDLSTRGGIYVFDVIRRNTADPEVQRPELRILTFEPTRSSVSNLCSIAKGILVYSTGQKIFFKALEQDRYLIPTAFYDTDCEVTSIRCLKNFLLVGDALRSISFLVYQELPYKVRLLGRDVSPISVSTAAFLLSDTLFSLVSCDTSGVLRLFDYEPYNIASNAGQKLLCRAEYALHTELTDVLPYASRVLPPRHVRQIALLLPGLNGSITSLVPVRDAVYRRLQLLVTLISRHIPQFAGLNPRAHHIVRNDTLPRALNKGILDGSLLTIFGALPRPFQSELAAMVGTDIDTLFMNMRHLLTPWG